MIQQRRQVQGDYRVTEEPNVKITFDKSATPFIMECFGLVPKRKYIYKKDGTRATCSYCGEELTLDTVAGILKMTGTSEDDAKPGVVCTGMACVMKLTKATEGR